MACTGIELISNQGHPFWARTQDFEQHFEYIGVKINKGFRFPATYTPFVTEVPVMGVVWAKDVRKSPVLLDGINEFGICGGSFYFDHFFKYTDTEEITGAGKVAIRGEELCTWILTHYQSLADIRQNLGKDVAITNAKGPMMGMSVPQHCVFIDSVGKSIVVEPSIEGGFKIFNNPLGVFTNAPTFDWHLNHVKTWLEQAARRSYDYVTDEEINQISFTEVNSGLLGIPSDYKPESRFIRAAAVKLLSIDVNDDEALNQIFQLLTAVNTPKGALRISGNDEFPYAWTQYTCGYDINSKNLFAFTYDNRNLKVLNYGNSDDWSAGMSYFSFIEKQTASPFTEVQDWQSGENTI